jgi:hypothetical protein
LQPAPTHKTAHDAAVGKGTRKQKNRPTNTQEQYEGALGDCIMIVTNSEFVAEADESM